MKDIERIEYYIFVNDNIVKLKRYSDLEELTLNAKRYIGDIDKIIGKSKVYIGIGAEFNIINDDSKTFGAIDFITRKKNEGKFVFCKDIETLDIKLPDEVKTALEGLIAEL